MATKQRAPFNRGLKFFCRKDLVFHGRRYARGDSFPWRRLSCSERQLRRLWDGRFLECGMSPEEAKGEPSKEEVKAKRAASARKAAETRKRNKAKLKAEAEKLKKAEEAEQRKAEAEAKAQAAEAENLDKSESKESPERDGEEATE